MLFVNPKAIGSGKIQHFRLFEIFVASIGASGRGSNVVPQVESRCEIEEAERQDAKLVAYGLLRVVHFRMGLFIDGWNAQ